VKVTFQYERSNLSTPYRSRPMCALAHPSIFWILLKSSLVEDHGRRVREVPLNLPLKSHFQQRPNQTRRNTLGQFQWKKTDTVSIAQKIIYRNYLPLWRCLRVINVFSFSQVYLLGPMASKHQHPRNWWFLRNGDFMVFWCVGVRITGVSDPRGGGGE